MEKSVLVHVCQSQHCLVHDASDLLFGESLAAVFHELIDVLLHEFEDEVKIIVDTNDLFELNDLGVVKLAQRLYFPKGHALLPRVKLLLHLLDGNFFLRLDVYGLDHTAICAVAERLQNLVPFHLNSFFIDKEMELGFLCS